MFKLIRNNKEMIWRLSLNDFSSKFAGSSFGVFWGFIQPIITIAVYACVFQFGLRSTAPVPGVSYIFWFAAGMVPWFFFADGVRCVTNSLLEYSYLVKKLVFDVEVLPIIKIISALINHLVFIALVFVIAFLGGGTITVYVVQIFYYMLCNILLIHAIGKITSCILPFFRDLGQIVNIVLDIAMWATPIIWPVSIVPEQFRWIVMLNPVFYIVEGYRDCFIGQKWMFESPGWTLYFLALLAVLTIVGEVMYKKLKPHFADVL